MNGTDEQRATSDAGSISPGKPYCNGWMVGIKGRDEFDDYPCVIRYPVTRAARERKKSATIVLPIFVVLVEYFSIRPNLLHRDVKGLRPVVGYARKI